jgi:hypothetical protein
MDRRGSEASDSEEYGLEARKARAVNKQKNRISKGNLNVNDGPLLVDDSPLTRKQK